MILDSGLLFWATPYVHFGVICACEPGGLVSGRLQQREVNTSENSTMRIQMSTR